MVKINLAILGARGNIGPDHIEKFLNAGVNVHAILGRDEEANREFLNDNRWDFGKDKPRVYSNLDELLSTEKDLNTVSIATPAPLHEDQVRKSLKEGLHVFCEKPFIKAPDNNTYQSSRELFDLANENRLILAVNTQLASIIPQISNYIPNNITSFSFYGEPSKKGIEMIPEFVPHSNSLLIELVGIRNIKNLRYPLIDEEELKIKFDYITEDLPCKVEYHFRYKKERPRALIFSINDLKFVRIPNQYNPQILTQEDSEIYLEDPLKVSIEKFISAVKGTGDTLVTPENTLDNILMQDQILQAYSNSSN